MLGQFLLISVVLNDSPIFYLKAEESVLTASHIHEPKVHHKQSWLENILDFATGVYTARVPGNGKPAKETISKRSQDFMDFSLSN